MTIRQRYDVDEWLVVTAVIGTRRRSGAPGLNLGDSSPDATFPQLF